MHEATREADETAVGGGAVGPAEPEGGAGSGPRPEPAAEYGMTFVIDQRRGGLWPRLREAYHRRGLLWMLVQRDIKVRYREAWLGIAWAVLVPAATACIYWVVFGYLGRIWEGDLPYVLFLFPAMLAWGYFNSSVGRASQSLKTDAQLLSKVYLPRVLLPLSNVVSPLVDLALGGVVMVGLLAYFGHAPSVEVVVVLPCLLLAAVAASGLGMGLAALNAYFRDVQHFLPVMLHLWFFCSPVLYGADLVPEEYRLWYALNPMVTVCEGVRWGVLSTFDEVAVDSPLTLGMIGMSVFSSVAMLVIGGAAFLRLEQSVTDVL